MREWQAKGGAVELHLYEKGGHGYGYPGRKGTTTMQWPADFWPGCARKAS